MKKILYLLSVVLCGGTILASVPLFQGRLEINSVDGSTNTGWRITGVFEDGSLLGFSASEIETNDAVFSYSNYGDVDRFVCTQVVSVAGANVTLDLIYGETGVPRAGAPVPGYQIICRQQYDGIVYLPSISFSGYTEYLNNAARNLSVKYAVAFAASNGIQGVTFTAGSSDGVTTNGKTAEIIYNNDAIIHTNQIGSGLLWDGSELTATNEGTVTGVAITYDEGTTNYASVSGNTNIHVSFKTNYSGGTGTITNMLSSDSSIVWGESGGPQPDGSVTAYVATAISGLATGTPIYTEADPVWESEKSGYATGTPLYVYSETDPLHTNWLATNTYVKAEVDPVWESEKSGYATGTPLYVESDPVWDAASTGYYTKTESDGQYATGTPVYVESDPVWESEKAGYATGTPVYAESDPVWIAVSNEYYLASNPSGFVTSAESEPLWTADSNNVWTAVGNRVLKSGDTMTGALVVSNNISVSGEMQFLDASSEDGYLAVDSGRILRWRNWNSGSPAWDVVEFETGNGTFHGAVTGASFSGNGFGLTNIQNPDGFIAGLLKSGNTTTTQGKIYQQLSDGTWQACYNTNVAYCNKAIGVAYGTNSSSAGMVVIGAVAVTNNNLSIGSNVYVGATAGEFTQVIPSADGSIIRAVGYAKNTNEIYVTPSPVWVEVGDLISENTDFNTFAATNISILQGVNNILNVSGSITNIGNLQASSLQITGGSPTNGAIFVATNTTGQGKWSWPVGFRAIISTNFTFSNDTATTIYFDTETYDYGNHFSTTTFVAPVNGIYNFKIYSTWVRTSGACSVVNTRALKNGVEMSRKQSGIIAGTFGTVDLDTGEVYLTNGAAITFTLVGQSAATNYLVAGEGFYVNGTLIRELP